MPKSDFLTGYKPNFKTLQDAVRNKDIALMECQDRATGNKTAVICAVNFDGNEYEMVPLARMFDGNPYEVLNPPSPDGGFYQPE